MKDQHLAYPLLEQTQDMLSNRPRNLTLRLISEECNVTEAWLQQVQSNILNEVGYKKLYRVHKFLKEEFNKMYGAINVDQDT